MEAVADQGLRAPVAVLGNARIMLHKEVDPDTLERVRLTTEAQSPSGDDEPTWSPGGKFIVFTRYSESAADVWIMDADGSDQRNLTPGLRSENTEPAWAPDGGSIAFTSDRTGAREIFVLHDVEGYTHEEIGEFLGVTPGTSAQNWSWKRSAAM